MLTSDRNSKRLDRPAGTPTGLSTLDRFLPLWIGAAMAVGLGVGEVLPDLDDWLHRLEVGSVSLPIAIGLLAMMYPVPAKVPYRHIGERLADRRTLTLR